MDFKKNIFHSFVHDSMKDSESIWLTVTTLCILQLSTTPHGVCYDVIAQCDEHLQSIGAVLPVGEDDSDEEAADEFSVASKRNDTPIVEVDEDWETDEEETRDVQMH